MLNFWERVTIISESLDQKLIALKLERIRQICKSWLEQAAPNNLNYAKCLEQLLTEELLARQENVLRRKMIRGDFLTPPPLNILISPLGQNSNARSSCATSTAVS